jgi:hypothetical protein
MQSTAPALALVVSPQSLATAFTETPDPRRAASVIYPLAATLTLAVSARFANHHSGLAILEWRAPGPRAPAHTRVSRRPYTLPIDAAAPDGPVRRAALARTLTQWFAPTAIPADDALQDVAIDGKAQQGRQRFPTTVARSTP